MDVVESLRSAILEKIPGAMVDVQPGSGGHYPIATMGAAPRMGEMAVDETPMPPVPAIMGSTTAPHADPPPQAKPNVVVVKPTGAATPAPHARMGKPALPR